ncbi:MAG TPA: glycosyltransferase family 4 protein [Candidatus Limnocylindrales bacterium]|nr:glycosyltransferase family 4 protein [Candidatus Limnocylindrales bacterium]
MTPRGRPALMIVHAYYAEDPRVRRQAETLVASGRPVRVIGLRRPGDPTDSELDGVRIRNLDVQRHQGAGIGVYVGEYLAFLIRAMWAAVRLHRSQRFAVAQVHSPPDFLVFATLPLRLVGVPVILDLHEAMPEFFRMRFPRVRNPLVHRMLRLQERLSIAFASTTITVTDAMRDRLIALGHRPDAIRVVANSPSLSRFDASAHPTRAFREDGRLRLVYTGALTPTYELDVTLRAVAAVNARRPDLDVALDLYGRGDSEQGLRALADELAIGDRVTVHGRIPIDDVPGVLAAADIGLAPTRLDRFTALTVSGKVYEYAAMRKPVVASRLPTVERDFPGHAVRVYESGDADGMADAIIGLADDDAARERSIEAASAVVDGLAWDRVSRDYVALVDALTGEAAPVSG